MCVAYGGLGLGQAARTAAGISDLLDRVFGRLTAMPLVPIDVSGRSHLLGHMRTTSSLSLEFSLSVHVHEVMRRDLCTGRRVKRPGLSSVRLS
jgi:hypothetical protein